MEMVKIDNFFSDEFLQRERLKSNTDIVSIFCIAGLAVNLVLGFGLGVFGLYEDFTVYMLTMVVVTVISMLCVGWICAKFCGGMKACIKKYEKKTGLSDNFLLVLFGFSGCMTVNLILTIISLFFPFIGSSNIDISEMNIYNVMLMMFAVALAPAVCEEIAFRGFVMGSLSEFGQGFAVIMTSVFFGMLHGNLSGILFAFSAGLLMGCVRKTSGSLVPSMTVHFLNNAYAVCSLCFMKMADGDEGLMMYAFFSFIFMLIMVVVFVISMLVLNSKNIGIFTFSSGDCVLTTSENAKVVLTRPLFWVFMAFAGIITVLSLGA